MGASANSSPGGGYHPHGRNRSSNHAPMISQLDSEHMANGAGDHATTMSNQGSRPEEAKYSSSAAETTGVGGVRRGSEKPGTSEIPMETLHTHVEVSRVDTVEKLSDGTVVTVLAGAAWFAGDGYDVKAGLGVVRGGGGGVDPGGVDLENGRRSGESSSSSGVSATSPRANPRDPEDWLRSHHNPESPLNSAPSTGPNTPRGQETIEHWGDDLFLKAGTQTDLVASGGDDDDERGRSCRGGGGGKGDPPPFGAPGKKLGEGSPFRRCWRWIGGEKSKKLRQVTWIVLVLASISSWWGTVYLVGGEGAGPNSEVFATMSLLLVAYFLGELTYRILGVHPLLGSFAGGFILRYVPGVEVGEHLSGKLAGHIRNFALVIIMLRAGLSLDVRSLAKIPELCLVSPTIPLAVEATVVAALLAWLLNFSWMWAFMAGFIVSAVSPGVVVPILLPLAEKGYGVDAGIPSLVLAVAALCDVLAIVGFSAFAEAALESSGPSASVARVFAELASGMVSGLLAGVLITFLLPRGIIVEPDTNVASLKKTIPHDEIDGRSVTTKRSMLLLGVGFVLYYTLKHYKYTGAAAMAAFVMGIPAAQGWGRRRTGRTQAQIAKVWIYVAQPLLFGVIGARLEIGMMTVSLLWKELVVLVVAGGVRWVVTVFVTSVGHVTFGERMFIASAWVSKATVQAAIGPLPLQEARARGNPMEIAMGEKVLVLATLSILVAGPTGAILSKILGPRLLTKGESKSADLDGH